MADITLTRQELEAGQLPLVCVASGVPVDTLTSLAVGPSKLPQVAALPSGLVGKKAVEKVSGSAITARIGRAPGVRTKQLAILGLRVVLGLFFLLRFVGALSAASIGGMLFGIVGIVGIAGIGGAALAKAVTVGFAATDDHVVISGAHADFIAAFEANPDDDTVNLATFTDRPATRPVVAAGLY